MKADIGFDVTLRVAGCRLQFLQVMVDGETIVFGRPLGGKLGDLHLQSLTRFDQVEKPKLTRPYEDIDEVLEELGPGPGDIGPRAGPDLQEPFLHEHPHGLAQDVAAHPELRRQLPFGRQRGSDLELVIEDQAFDLPGNLLAQTNVPYSLQPNRT